MRGRSVQSNYGVDVGHAYDHSDPWYYGSIFVRGHKYFNHRNDNFEGGHPLTVEICYDDTSPPPYHEDNPLNIHKIYTDPLRINGRVYKLRPDGSIDIESVLENYSGYWCDNWRDAWSSVKSKHHEIDSDDFRNQLTIDAVSNIIDTVEPDVDILNFLYEMREFPRMLKDIGDTLLRGDFRAPNWHLAVEFGWKPLISDLRKLTDFQEKVNRRLKYLDKLSKGKVSLRRTLSNDKGVPWGTPWLHIHDVVQIESHKAYSRKSWYTARVSSDKVPDLYADRVKMARDLAYNTKLRPSTVWNSIPWTWLIDWFTNLGTYIKIGNNSLDMRWEKLNVMTYQNAWQSGEVIGINPGYSPMYNQHELTGNYSFRVESKMRHQAASLPFEFLKVGFLTSRQFSILGSLALARKTKYHY